MSPAPLSRRTALALPAALLLAAVALAIGCACFPSATTNAPTARTRPVAPPLGPPEDFRPSIRLLEIELGAHLPRPTRATGKPASLTVTQQSGLFFGTDTFVITVVGDFTPERTKAFAEHARALHNHLNPQPRFIVHVFRDTLAGIEPVADYEFK